MERISSEHDLQQAMQVKSELEAKLQSVKMDVVKYLLEENRTDMVKVDWLKLKRMYGG